MKKWLGKFHGPIMGFCEYCDHEVGGRGCEEDECCEEDCSFECTACIVSGGMGDGGRNSSQREVSNDFG